MILSHISRQAKRSKALGTLPSRGTHDMVLQSRENRDLFAASPEKYAPQYDGWCAWAMTEARKAVTDPEVWKIVDGKLYLNCSPAAYEKMEQGHPRPHQEGR